VTKKVLRKDYGFIAPFLNAFLYGLTVQAMALPCSGPLESAFSRSPSALPKRWGVWWSYYGLARGFGLPSLLLSFLAEVAQCWITCLFALHAVWIHRIGGVLLVWGGALCSDHQLGNDFLTGELVCSRHCRALAGREGLLTTIGVSAVEFLGQV
jgi:cytochrome c biogenesis protein CcdA